MKHCLFLFRKFCHFSRHGFCVWSKKEGKKMKQEEHIKRKRKLNKIYNQK